MNIFRRCLFAIMIASSSLLVGCNLIQDTLGIGPGKGTLQISYTGVLGFDSKASIIGSDFNKQLFDDGTGYKSAYELKVGTYSISASAIPGYTAYVSVSQANGNITHVESNSASLEANQVVFAKISYAKILAIPAP
jgi:hypothetical protein